MKRILITGAAGKIGSLLHTARTPNGVRGFRWWTWPKGEVPSDFKPCKCGWSGLPHYALPGSKSVARVR